MSVLPPIFVVSLPASPRRRAVETMLATWRGPWSFVDAVDGTRLSVEELAAIYDEHGAVRTRGYPLSRPEIGCALSHRKVYQEIAERELQQAIVLEDDAACSARFLSFPFDTIGDFDVVSFHTCSAVVRTWPRMQLGDVQLYRAAGRVSNTVAYLVSLAGARKLLAASAPIRSVADWPLYPADFRFFVAAPNLVCHTRADSSIAVDRDVMRRQWTLRRSRFRWLTQGAIANLTDPMFIKFLLYRDQYEGAANYFRREVAEPVKRMLPFLYRHLRDSAPHANHAGRNR